MLDFFKGLFSSKKHVEEPMEVEVKAAPALPPRSLPSEPPPPPPPPKRVAERIPDAGAIEVDFVAVLDESGVDEVDRDRISRAQQLLRTLPPDAPSALKRQIVEAAFQVFDVPTPKIISASSSAVDALRTYVRSGQERTERRLSDGEERIAELEASIRAERAAMERAKEVQQQREELTAREIDGIEPILRFFVTEATSESLPLESEAGMVAELATSTGEDRPSPVPADDESLVRDASGEDTAVDASA